MSFEIPHFYFCTRTLLFFGKSTLIQPPTHFLIFVLTYMIDGPSEGQRNKGCSWQKSSLTFGCARHKLMTHYVHTGTVRDRAARRASRYDRENEAVSTRRYGLSARTIHNHLRKKKLSHQCGPPLIGRTMTTVLEWPQSHAIRKTTNMITNKYEPQQKCRLGTVSKNTVGLKPVLRVPNLALSFYHGSKHTVVRSAWRISNSSMDHHGKQINHR